MPAGTITNTTLASGSHGAGSSESFDVSAFKSALQPGANELAIEGHNVALADSDFWLDLELVPTLGPAPGAPLAVLDCDRLSANVPARIAFSGSSSEDPEGLPLHSLLDFGDGHRVAAASAQHVYPVEGTYVVSLLVRDPQQLGALEQRTIRVHSIGDAPVARIRAVSRSIDGHRIVFSSADSYDPDGGRVLSHWDFGDAGSGEQNHSAGAIAAHAFATAGEYTVTLAVTDDEGSTSIATAQWRVP
jgi:PKD repeat protein